MKKLFFSVISTIVFTTLTMPITFCQAAEFDKNFVLSDEEALSFQSMNLQEVKDFLASKNSSLLNYEAIDINGEIKTAPQIIYETSQRHQINPKFILVMLQKEQSLVQNSTPTQKQYDWAMGYGVCDDCSMDDPALMKFKGFGNQVEKAIARFKWYYENPTVFRTKGKTYEISNDLVTPINQTTANLYSYTPHIHGNYLFWKIWQRWFKQYYPDGSVVKTSESPAVYLLEYGLKRPIQSWSAFISRYQEQNILLITAEELEKYELGAPIKFPNYSLLKQADGKIFLLVDDTLRHIDSMETFRMIGFNIDEVENATAEELQIYKESLPITVKSTYPLGALIQEKNTQNLYFVQEGFKYPVYDPQIITINYPNHRVLIKSEIELEAYETKSPVRIKDGTLVKVKDNPNVYVVAKGKKQLILDEKTFTTLNYDWNKIYVINQEAMEALNQGEILNLKFKD